jgi:hypothetical protein
VDSTTVNNADAETLQSEITFFRDIPSELLSSASTGIVQDIKTFLAKPVAIQSGVLSSSDTVSTFTPIDVPYDVIQLTPFLDKMKGFMGFRGNFVFRLQINGNRFQQGRYMLAWVPLAGADSSSTHAAGWYNSHTYTLTQRSQLPHVELDVCCDTSATFVVPFINAFTFYPINSASSKIASLGKVVIFPYVSVTAPTGSSTVSYTLWVHMEDVVLHAPTVPQSGRILSGRKSKQNASESEQANAGVRPLSSGLRAISSGASLLTQIPLLSAFAAPVSWVADIASNVAWAFGYSKPLNLEHVTRVRREIFPYFPSVEAVDNAQPLSFFSRNMVESCEGFSGTDVDELAFANFLTIPSYFSTTSWSTSSTVGTSLKAFPLSPGSFYVQTTTSTNSLTNHTPMSLIQNFFTQWRGGFVFTFKFVKTEFHSGRLAVTFVPYCNAVGTPTVNLAATNFVHREIIDIRYANEVSFTVPYVAILPYLSSGDIMGYVNIFVVDPLVAPASVSSTISIISEVSATPDMEFAVPRTWNDLPLMNVTPQSGNFLSGLKPASDPCVETRSVIGNSKNIGDSHKSSTTCVGEKITSIRQLLKVPSVGYYTGVTANNSVFANIIPFAVSTGTIQTTTITYPVGASDAYSLFSSIFAVSRGGVRLKGVPDPTISVSAGQVSYPYIVSLGDSYSYASPYNFSTIDLSGSSSFNRAIHTVMQPQDPGVIGGFDVSVPQYHSQFTRSNVSHLVFPGSTYQTSLTGGATKYGVSVRGNNYQTNPYFIARATSDDFNLGLFVSIPPVTGTVA